MDGLFMALAGVAGAAVGAVVAWLITERRGRGALSAAETARAVTEQRAAGLEAEMSRQAGERTGLLQQHAATMQQREATIEDLRQRLGSAEKSQATAEAALRAGEHALEEKRRALTETQAELERLRAEAAEARNQHTAASEALKASQENIAEQRKLIDEANQRLSAAFAEVSRGALERAGVTFFEMAKAKFDTLSAEAGGDLEKRKEQIATLLKPMEEIMAAYQKRLAEIETARSTAYGDLLRQIGGMSETQRLLATQTTNLASALKKSNVRGRWGEIALERLVELAGMTEHVDFSQQESLRSEDGMLRPDMIVKFAGNRQVVIDSKAVMAAFLEAAAAVDDAAREAHLRMHAQYVRSRVNDLSSKAYWSQFKTMPEFTVLFLPGESFLYAACDHDPELIQYAIDRKVLLATPTTLIALLRTVELGWRQEEVSQNAEHIRTLGVEIYDRLAVLADHLTRLGSSLGSAVDNYNKVVGTVEQRILVSARKMGELGARNEKTIETVEAVEKRPREFSEALHPEKSPLLPG